MTFTAFENYQAEPAKPRARSKEVLQGVFLRSPFGYYYDIGQVFASVASCVLYVASTYFGEDDGISWREICQAILAVVFLFDFCVQVAVTDKRLARVFSLQTVVDIVTIVPSFLALFSVHMFDSTLFLRVFGVFRVIRLNRSYRAGDGDNMENGQDSLSRVLLKMIVIQFVLIVVSASGIQIIEYLGGHDLEFHDAIYFIIVSSTTVGYGDIVPQTVLGKMYTSVFLLVAISLIPVQTARIVEFMMMRSKYSMRYQLSRGDRAVLAVGDISFPRLRALSAAFFHDSRKCDNLHLVVLSTRQPDRDIKLFLRNRLIAGRIHYLQGSSVVESDIRRTDIANVSACILFSGADCGDVKNDDERTILRSLVIKTVCQTVPIFVELWKAEDAHRAFSNTVDYFVSRHTLRRGLLACNVRAAGSSTLIANLFRAPPVLSSLAAREVSGCWLQEYYHGLRQGIYPFAFPKCAAVMDYAALVVYMFVTHNIVVMGCVRKRPPSFDDARNRTHVSLSSFSDPTPFKEGDILLVISTSVSAVADVIARFKAAFPIRSGSSRRIRPESSKQSVTSRPASKQEIHATADPFDFARSKSSALIPHSLPPIKRSIGVADAEGSSTNPSLLRSIVSTSVSVACAAAQLKPAAAASVFHTCRAQLLSDVTVDELPAEVSNHIIVCGDMSPSLVDLVAPLRRKEDVDVHPIVFLTQRMSAEAWRGICCFPELFVIHGEPDHVSSLMRCGADRALHLIFVAGDQKIDEKEPEFVDFRTIFLHHTIAQNFPVLDRTVEQVYGSNIAFAEPKLSDQYKSLRKEASHSLFAPLYAAGQAFADTIIDQFAAFAFFNPFAIDLVHQLISVPQLHSSSGTSSVRIVRLPVAAELVQRRWDECFRFLVEMRQVLPMALYRVGGTLGSKLPYVYTSPPGNAVVQEGDFVFVMVSSDFQDDAYPMSPANN
jgi:hypothetical protein